MRRKLLVLTSFFIIFCSVTSCGVQMPEGTRLLNSVKEAMKFNSDLEKDNGYLTLKTAENKFSSDIFEAVYKESDDNDIAVSAILLPDFPEEIAGIARPEFNISSTELDFGKLGKKKKVSGRVEITNKGRGTLQLQAIQVFNHALSVSLPKKVLAPGESIKMKVTLMAKYLGQSKSQPRVLLITNDPKHPKEIVTVKFQK